MLKTRTLANFLFLDPSKNSFKKIISFQAKNEKNSIEIVDRPRAVPLHEPQSTRQYVQ